MRRLVVSVDGCKSGYLLIQCGVPQDGRQGKKDRWSWGAIVGSTVEVTVEVTMEVTVEDTVKAFAAALVVDAAVATTLTAAEGHGITKVHEDDGQGAPADVDHEET
ncbi:hypothetical protein MTO96_033446 [Rhipicephalus appendiculatus]